MDVVYLPAHVHYVYVLATGLAISLRAWVRPTRLRLERWARGWTPWCSFYIFHFLFFSPIGRGLVFLGSFLLLWGRVGGGWRMRADGLDAGSWGCAR